MARAAGNSDEGADDDGKVGSAPNKNIADVRPLAMFGGKSVIEVNNPDLGPSDAELNERKKKFKKIRDLYRKKD